MEARWETPSLVADGTEITQCINYRIFQILREIEFRRMSKVKNAIFTILNALKL